MPSFSTPHDAAVAEDIENTLANHIALRDTKIAVIVRGGVTHIRGETDSLEQRDLIRRVVLKTDGVLHVMVPHWQCVNAVADPTHCDCFTARPSSSSAAPIRTCARFGQ